MVSNASGRDADQLGNGVEDLLAILPGVDPEPVVKRQTCQKCSRPPQVCWCAYLPAEVVTVKSVVYILQHPFEESRCLSTTPILYHCLPDGHRHILRGPRINLKKHTELAEALSNPSTLLLYPTPDAVPINELPHGRYNLLVLDGTWMQARGVYTKNAFLHSLKKVKLVDAPLSQYVIRTQPKNECLSTLESVALALETLEHIPGLYDTLTLPLRALCQFQIAHGAVAHQSKQYLIENGLYKGQQRRQQHRAERQAQRLRQHEAAPETQPSVAGVP